MNMEKQNEKNKLNKLPACAAEYIRTVIKKMQYRRKIRRDVMAELTSHFEDELKNLTTDEQKWKKAQQLITEFGDTKLLALLLRRAKKRCRPLWRTVVARAFQTVGVLIVCFILYVAWFLTGKPVITTNYIAELNNLVRPTADESLNAAPLYNKCIEVFKELPPDIAKAFGKRPYEVTEADKQLIGKWMTDNDELLKQVIAGTRKPYYWQAYEGEDMFSVLLPHLAGYRNTAKSLCWRSRLLAEKGQYEQAFNDIKACYRFGRHVKASKVVLVEQLVGIAIEALAVQTLREILSEHQINSTILTSLQKDLEQIKAGGDFLMSFEGEKLFIYDEIQRCFTEDRLGGGHLYLNRISQVSSAGDDSVPSLQELILESIFTPKAWSGAVKVLFFHPDKQQTREATDRFYAYCETIAKKNPAQIRAEGIDVEKEYMKIIKDNVFLMILTPALEKVSEIGHRHRTNVEATVAILALLRHKADKGSFPNDLKQLVSTGYLRQLPFDVYSDKPLVYKKTDDSCILYSFGPNLEDDGGEIAVDNKGRPKKWAPEGDVVFWPVPEPQVVQ
jgi:hypothetical protein